MPKSFHYQTVLTPFVRGSQSDVKYLPHSINYGTCDWWVTAKKIEVAFFETVSGHSPVREWLRELSREDRRQIGEDIKAVEFGWPIGMPTCRSLGRGLYEVRSALKDRIARVMFLIDGGEMVLLHAFMKKSQVTPKGDMDLARKRQREWESAK